MSQTPLRLQAEGGFIPILKSADFEIRATAVAQNREAAVELMNSYLHFPFVDRADGHVFDVLLGNPGKRKQQLFGS